MTKKLRLMCVLAHPDTVRRAVRCHDSQLPAYSLFEDVGEEQQHVLWECKRITVSSA